MAVARIDNVWDLVDTCSRRLAVMQKTTSYSNNYILNTEKSIKKNSKVQKDLQSNTRLQEEVSV